MAKFLTILSLIGPMIGFTPHTGAQSSAQQTGIAKFYSPGVMAQVARNRHMKLRTDVDGYAAVLNCTDVGKIVVATINGRKQERYQVLDCSQPYHRADHIRQRLIIEVDYASAVRNGFARLGKAPATIRSMEAAH